MDSYISKSIILRIAIIVVLFAGAFAFDFCHHDQSNESAMTKESPSSHSLDVSQVYFFNPVSSFKIREHGDKLLTRILMFGSHDKFLSMFHNHRAFHTLKEDSLKDLVPLHLMAHFVKFTQVAYSSPDDYPPFS